jgi:hypothetical protein
MLLRVVSTYGLGVYQDVVVHEKGQVRERREGACKLVHSFKCLSIRGGGEQGRRQRM